MLLVLVLQIQTQGKDKSTNPTFGGSVQARWCAFKIRNRIEAGKDEKQFTELLYGPLLYSETQREIIGCDQNCFLAHTALLTGAPQKTASQSGSQKEGGGENDLAGSFPAPASHQSHRIYLMEAWLLHTFSSYHLLPQPLLTKTDTVSPRMTFHPTPKKSV